MKPLPLCSLTVLWFLKATVTFIRTTTPTVFPTLNQQEDSQRRQRKQNEAPHWFPFKLAKLDPGVTPDPCSSTQHWGKPASKWSPGWGWGVGRQRNGECIAPLPLSLGHLLHFLYEVLTQFLLWRKNVGKQWTSSPLAVLSRRLGELSAPRTAPAPPSCLWPTLGTAAILPLAFSRTPSRRGLRSEWGWGRGGGLSFCVSWWTLASDRPCHYGENTSQEPVSFRLSVEDPQEPRSA